MLSNEKSWTQIQITGRPISKNYSVLSWL